MTPTKRSSIDRIVFIADSKLPPTPKVSAIEHQYNFGDPFGKEWNGMDTGMVTLKPGGNTRWHVRIKVFSM